MSSKHMALLLLAGVLTITDILVLSPVVRFWRMFTWNRNFFMIDDYGMKYFHFRHLK